MQTLSDQEFNKLCLFAKQNYGIDLSNKKTLVETKLLSYLAGKGYKSFLHFYHSLINDRTGNEAAFLVNRLTTNYTYFMREAESFNFFRDTAVPYMAAAADNGDLRIWSAGCSSGEEPYTLAMILKDHFGQNELFWDTKILATDISTRVLEQALEATYGEEQIRDLPAVWKLKYFEPDQNGRRRLVQAIREGVIFRKFNLMEKYFPFKQKFHVIFCRNVMIYFDNETRKQLINRFYDFTETGGYLIVGVSEAINRRETRYKFIMPAVYRKE
ncbi:MAG TPA: protein-glutamate O-methyltransferase CheR [Syntrophomonadaceae bacterium]|nr:protein-glutamate O-methyltransferase CheR [Syntrophomonadaceae bacterium]